jgi:hypothetical protein
MFAGQRLFRNKPANINQGFARHTRTRERRQGPEKPIQENRCIKITGETSS